MTSRFEAFGPVHGALLALCAVGVVGAVLLGRSGLGRLAPSRLDRALAVLTLVVGAGSQAYQLTPGDFDLASSLPLQLCDLAWLMAGWALWTRRRLPVAVTYYWGLTLTVQGVLTPSLAQSFPHPRFLMFWALHLLVVWVAVYLSIGHGLGPGWREYGWTVVISLGWAVGTYAFDVAAGVNYGYLVAKPGSASLLDPLGPWPVYVVATLGLLLAGWALMTWPWVLRDRRRARAG